MSDSLTVYGTGCFTYASGVQTNAAARAILINCTATGDCTMQFPDGSTLTINLQGATVYSFNYAIVKFTLNSGTATAYGIL